jgi:hypothetical protein
MDAGIGSVDIARATLEERLEQGEIHVLSAPLPFSLPSAADQDFLREQELFRGKEIVFEARADRVTGYRPRSQDQHERLRRILADSGQAASLWLSQQLPHYAPDVRLLRCCFHVAEEATRRLRVTSRHDLLHIDALHQSGRQRILRLFVNLNPVDPRVWATSETLAKILPLYGPKSGLTDPAPRHWPRRIGQEVLRLFRAESEAIDPYDRWMLAFTRYLKHSDEFQEKAPRRIWRLAPGQAWLAFTDSLAHADLRGRWVLDHLFLIPPERCVRPELSPSELWRHFGRNPRLAA